MYTLVYDHTWKVGSSIVREKEGESIIFDGKNNKPVAKTRYWLHNNDIRTWRN